MLNYILKPIKHESFYKKYAGKRYLKVRRVPYFLKLVLIILSVKCMGLGMGSRMLGGGHAGCARR